MPHDGCPSKENNYLYTAVEGSIQLNSGQERIIDYQEGDGCGSSCTSCTDSTACGSCHTWRCIQGDIFCHPESFNPVTGIFTAPTSNFYQVSLTVNYFYIQPEGTDRITGISTTTLQRNLQKNICGLPGTGFDGLDIAVLSSTNPFSAFGDNTIASAVISYDIPLQRGDQLKVLIFQENDADVAVTIFSEWLIKRGKRLDPCLTTCRC